MTCGIYLENCKKYSLYPCTSFSHRLRLKYFLHEIFFMISLSKFHSSAAWYCTLLVPRSSHARRYSKWPVCLVFYALFLLTKEFFTAAGQSPCGLHARIVAKRYYTGLWLSEYSNHYATDSCWYKDLIVTAASIIYFVSLAVFLMMYQSTNYKLQYRNLYSNTRRRSITYVLIDWKHYILVD